MATPELPLESSRPVPHLMVQHDAHRFSAVRIACTYLLAGLVWIGISDLGLAYSGGLTTAGLVVAVSKGAVFVVLSTWLVYWLCRREYRQLEKATDLLRSVIQGTSDAIFVKDLDGKYLLSNSAAAQFMGRTVDEVLGRDDRDLFEGAEVEQLMANDRAIMAQRNVVTIEETLTSDGVTRTYQATKAPFYDSTGTVIGLIGIGRNVTDQKLVESTLRETDERLREAQRIAKLGSWNWEPSTNRVWWSDAEFELFGVAPQGVPPGLESFLAFLHPDDRPVALARVDAMLAGANEFANDLRVVRADGTYMWIHSQARATRDLNDKIIRVEGIDQDITAQRLAREAVLESERKLQAAVEVAGLGVIAIDYESQRVEMSPRAAEQFGFAPDANISRSDLHLRFHPADEQELQHSIAGALDPNGNGLFSLEHRVIRPDGSVRWLNVRKQVMFELGKPRHAVVVTADVTERRNAETKLREQEMLVREAVELAKVGGWGFDPVTLQSDWTPAVAKMCGLAPDAIPAVDTALNFFNSEQRPALQAAMASAMQDGVEHDMELQLTAADGVKRWVRSICRPIKENGRVIRVRGSLQDITDRKRIESELRASEERYRLLFESNPHPMWVYDVDTLKFLAVNDAAVQAYGYTRDEFLAMTIRAIRPAEDVAKLEFAIANADPTLTHRGHWRHQRKDGTIFDVDISSHELPQQQGRTRLVLALDITDRRRAELELRASERRFRLALESAGAIAFVWDIPTDSVTRYYSTEPALPVTVERAGTLSEVRAQIHPDDVPAFDARLAACLADGIEYRNAYRVVRADGTVACLEDYGFVDRTADGTPLSLTGLVLDVTDRVTATDALRTSEARYRQLVDMLPTAVFVHAENKILFGNVAFLRLMGAKSLDEVLGRSPFDLVHHSSHEMLRRRQEELTRTKSPLSGCDMVGLRLDGRTVPVHSVAAPVEGYGMPATLVALNDLTERERSAALLRSVLDSVGDAIITINTRGVVTSANRATEQLFGYTVGDLLGGNVSTLIPEPHRQNHDRYIANYVRTHERKVIGVGREVEGRRKDGSTFPAELIITEFHRDGELEFTGVLRDITSRRQLEEQFRQAQKMEAVGRLAGGVAHDFNNLLTVINGYSELVLTELSADDPARGPLAAIHDAGDRAARLTEQLLAFSRKSMVEPQLVDLNKLVVESAKLFRRLIGEDIALSVLTDPSPVRVLLDPGQLEQVLMNLAINARDAMPIGGRLTIETRTRELSAGADRSHPELPPGWYASLRVTDTGCGMSVEDREKIFEPFFTTKGIGKGTGLGLAVVHGIVQQSGGSITVDSTVGAGSTFYILLPAVTDVSRDAALREAAFAASGDETILVVEDEEAVRTLIRVALEGQGYTVLTASGGNEARDVLLAHSRQVDILLTDVIMPEISGRELAIMLRAVQPGLRVLYMSGYTDDALDRHGLQGSSDHFIQKPFTPLGLARTVREIIDGSSDQGT